MSRRDKKEMNKEEVISGEMMILEKEEVAMEIDLTEVIDKEATLTVEVIAEVEATEMAETEVLIKITMIETVVAEEATKEETMTREEMVEEAIEVETLETKEDVDN